MSTAAMTAEAKTNDKLAENAAPGRIRISKRKKIFLIILSLVLMGVFRTGFMFIIIGMMPSIVTYYSDVSRKHYTFKTILCFNLSGIMPFIGQMITHGPGSSTMQAIMGDASNWFMIYGAALIGWLMVRVTPVIAHVMISGFYSTQIMHLTGTQKRIENEWGTEVTQFSKREEEENWFL